MSLLPSRSSEVCPIHSRRNAEVGLNGVNMAHNLSAKNIIKQTNKQTTHPWELTWNLKITHLSRKIHLPNLHHCLPCKFSRVLICRSAEFESMGSLAMDPSVIFIAILVAIWFSFFWSSSLVWSLQNRWLWWEHLHSKWKSKIWSKSNSCSLIWEVLYGYMIHLYVSVCKNKCRDFSAGQIGFAEGSLLRVTWSFADWQKVKPSFMPI